MTVLLAAVAGVFGLLIGSFLNVVIHRVPAGESIVTPRSRCPECGTELSNIDNIPVLSWLLLRGKCRSCGAPISARYPVVELLTGVAFAAIAAWRGLDPALPAYLVFIAAAIALAAIDLDTFTLPRQIIYPTLVACAVLLAVAAVIDDDFGSLVEAGIGAALAFGFLFIVNFVYPKGMGFGDVRLSAVLGLMLGWITLGHVPVGLFLSFLLASVIGVGLIAIRKAGRKQRIPFGPFLVAGTVLTFFVGQTILDAYLGASGL